MTCKCGCGQPATTKGYCDASYARWRRAGFPEGGPRPPLSRAECGLRSAVARAPGPDDYDLRWAAAGPERRVNRVRRQAAHLIRCVAARDGAGVARLLEKVRDAEALLIVLAECCDPARAAVVCGPLMAAAERSEVAVTDGMGDADAAA